MDTGLLGADPAYQLLKHGIELALEGVGFSLKPRPRALGNFEHKPFSRAGFRHLLKFAKIALLILQKALGCPLALQKTAAVLNELRCG